MAEPDAFELEAAAAFGNLCQLEMLNPTPYGSTKAEQGSTSHQQTDLPPMLKSDTEGTTTSTTESVPEDRRQIGVFSAIFLVFNRTIGTGIFATPSTILALTGSVGMSLVVWLVGMIIAMAGTAVYLEFGTAIPVNGGEKNYLEYVYTKPKFLITAIYASYALLIGWAAGNRVIFGEYFLHALEVGVNRWNQRGVGIVCITTAFVIHATAVKWGLRIQNAFGILKLIVTLLIVVAGLLACAGFVNVEKPNNFDNPWGDKLPTVYGLVTALYNVIWSYVGYSNANYCLSETVRPARTLKIACLSGIGMIGAIYFLINVAYFAAVPKEDMLHSGRILAASFFRNVFGVRAERALSVFIVLCAFGNVLAVLFSQGRIIQALGREGVLPFSRFWASNRPFKSPAAGLFEHYVVAVVIMLAPPPGDAHNFLLNLAGYPFSMINALVSAGLLHIYFCPTRYRAWSPTFRASWGVVFFFFISNVFLVVAPLLPPPLEADNVYEKLPYYSHCIGGVAVFGLGALYWLVWARLLPRLGSYRLAQITTIGRDGWSRRLIQGVPRAPKIPESHKSEQVHRDLKDEDMWI